MTEAERAEILGRMDMESTDDFVCRTFCTLDYDATQIAIEDAITIPKEWEDEPWFKYHKEEENEQYWESLFEDLYFEDWVAKIEKSEDDYDYDYRRTIAFSHGRALSTIKERMIYTYKSHTEFED